MADPYYDQVVLLLHGDGSDNGTTFADQKGHAITRGGNTVTKTGTKKYGTASLYFDGSGDYLSAASSAEFNLGAGDFTIEMWIRPSQVSAGAYFIAKGANPASAGRWALVQSSADPTKIGVRVGDTDPANNGGAFEVSFDSSASVSVNNWYHVALVRSGSTFTLYVDGVSSGSGTMAASVYHAANPIYVGANSDLTGYYTGYIDDVRITNGVARYTADFTPPAEAFPDARGSTLTDPYYDQVVLHLTGDGGEDWPLIFDQKGHVLNLSGAPVTKTGTKKYGTASIFFDGSNDYIYTTPTSYDFMLRGSAFTLEGWFNFSSTNTTPHLFQTGTGSTDRFALYRWSDGWLYVYRNVGGSSGVLFHAANTITSGQWYHIALVCDLEWIALYVNGVLEGHVRYSAAYFPTGASYFEIGFQGYAGTANDRFYGYADDIRITKGVARYTHPSLVPAAPFPGDTDPYWSSTKALLHMDGADNGTTFTDEKGHTFTAVANAVTKTGQKQFGTAAAYLDGTGDQITTPSSTDFSFGTGDFSIECWVYCTNTTGVRGILDTRATDTDSGFLLYQSGQTVSLFASNATRVSSAAFALAANTWTHIAVYRRLGILRLYVNGIPGVQTAYASSITCPGSLTIGHGPQPAYTWVGYIDEVRITKGVDRLFDGTALFTPPAAAFPTTREDSYDPYWDDVALLLHMDGADDGTTFTDEKGHTFSRTGTPVTKTGTKKYGTAAYYSDGYGDQITTPASTDFDFGAGDFTIEAWINCNSTNYPIAFLETRSAAGDTGYSVYQSLSTGVISFLSSGSARCASAAVTTNTWAHIAVVRAAGIMRVFKDGVPGTAASFASSITCPGLLRLGHLTGAGNDWSGYLDDFRITKGIARYQTTFIPPTAALPHAQDVTADVMFEAAWALAAPIIAERIANARWALAANQLTERTADIKYRLNTYAMTDRPANARWAILSSAAGDRLCSMAYGLAAPVIRDRPVSQHWMFQSSQYADRVANQRWALPAAVFADRTVGRRWTLAAYALGDLSADARWRLDVVAFGDRPADRSWGLNIPDHIADTLVSGRWGIQTMTVRDLLTDQRWTLAGASDGSADYDQAWALDIPVWDEITGSWAWLTVAPVWGDAPADRAWALDATESGDAVFGHQWALYVPSVWAPVVTATTYVLTLTGAADALDDVVLPMSNFQTRLSRDGSSYLQVTVPNGRLWALPIALRSQGELVISRGVRWSDDRVEAEEIARATLSAVAPSVGGRSSSVSLQARRNPVATTPRVVALTGASYWTRSGNKRRYRLPINNALRPGDTAQVDGNEFVVGTVQHTVGATGSQMEIVEA